MGTKTKSRTNNAPPAILIPEAALSNTSSELIKPPRIDSKERKCGIEDNGMLATAEDIDCIMILMGTTRREWF